MSPRGRVWALRDALDDFEPRAQRVDAWGRELADRLLGGGRLLAAGNGGSAAEAQHLTAELVGRFETERTPLAAIALHAETSSLTALSNDFGYPAAFSRQVRAHGRPGDVLLCLSTSGTSDNLLAAVGAAGEAELVTWALTGPAPNPLTEACDDWIAIGADSPATVQEVHLLAIHLLCGAVDARVCTAEGAREVVR